MNSANNFTMNGNANTIRIYRLRRAILHSDLKIGKNLTRILW